MTSSLSLFVIEDGLAELLLARQEAADDLARLQGAAGPPKDHDLDLAEARDALAIIDKTLAEYLTLEVRKVDNYHRFVKSAELLCVGLKDEESAIRSRRQRIEAAVKWLKGKALAAMQAVDKKRIEGTNGRYLLRKGNGGMAALVVDSWDPERGWTQDMKHVVLPDKYMDVTITMSLDNWWQIVSHVGVFAEQKALRKAIAPAGDRIRSALAEPCDTCGGAGSHPGVDGPCPTCNGRKTKIIPGARLAERGEHIEVK